MTKAEYKKKLREYQELKEQCVDEMIEKCDRINAEIRRLKKLWKESKNE